MHEALKASLDGSRATAGLRYAVQMWDYALACAAAPAGAPVAVAPGVNALPYVPEPVCTLLPDKPVLTVLDVGCLGGYGLFDLARRMPDRTLRLIGVDVNPAYVGLGRTLAPHWAAGKAGNPGATFREASAESLPLPDGGVDLIIARLLLPYVAVDAALREFRRVAASEAVLLVQTHAPGYYRRQMRSHWRDPPALAYYVRPLLTGLLLQLTGYQPRHRYWREVALSRRDVIHRCRCAGFACAWQDSAPAVGRPLLAFRLSGPRDGAGRGGRTARERITCMEAP